MYFWTNGDLFTLSNSDNFSRMALNGIRGCLLIPLFGIATEMPAPITIQPNSHLGNRLKEIHIR